MSSDWEQAQRLIDRGYCTLEQVREAIAVQDRRRRAGAAPGTLWEVLLEKRYVTAEQLAEAGLTPPPASGEPSPPGPAVRRFSPLAWGGLAFLAVLGIIVVERKLAPPPEGSSGRGDPGGAEADRSARRELEEIRRFQDQSADFENAEEVIRRYRSFMGRQAGSRWELEAFRHLKAYREQLEARARAELEALRRREAPLEAAGRWAERLRLYRAFPERFLNTTEAGAEAAGRREEISRRMEEAFGKGKREALACLEAGKPDEAERHIQALEPWVPEGREEEVAALRARVEGERRIQRARWQREIADEYLRLDGPFREAMGRRNPREAAAVTAGFLFRPRPDEWLRLLRVEGVDYGALKEAVESWRPEEIVAATEAGVEDRERPDPARSALMDLRSAALVGLFLDDAARAYRAAVESSEALELPSLGRGHFERQGGRVFFRSEGRPPAVAELSTLREEDLEALASRVSPGEPFRSARAGFFHYYAGKGHLFRSYLLLARARDLGMRGIGPYLENLAPAIEKERGRELEIKFGAAEDCLRRGEWVTGKILLEELRKHADHPFVRERVPRIERMSEEVDEALRRERRFGDLYRGRVEVLGTGALRVTYDFRDPVQMEAFEPAGGEEGIRGRWSFREGGMESSRETAAIRWRTPVRGDVEVEFVLLPLEEPQNMVLALYNRKHQAAHYAVVFGFDWVGRSEGDPGNAAEDRFGMPRTCVIKYPVKVEKARWKEDASWAVWRSRLVGRALEPWRLQAEKAARIRVERRGPGIRVEADGKGIWEGEDAEYTEGQLLFFSDCRCRLGPLRITFRP